MPAPANPRCRPANPPHWAQSDDWKGKEGEKKKKQKGNIAHLSQRRPVYPEGQLSQVGWPSECI